MSALIVVVILIFRAQKVKKVKLEYLDLKEVEDLLEARSLLFNFIRDHYDQWWV